MKSDTMMRRYKYRVFSWSDRIIRWVSKRKVAVMGTIFLSIIYLHEVYLFKTHLAQTEYLAKLQTDQMKVLYDYESVVELPENPSPQTHKVMKSNITLMKMTPPPVTQPLPPAPPKRAPGPDTRYLVYTCSDFNYCGGWGDRQKGLTSVYLLSRVTDREFRIIMSTPCDLANFFMPNIVPWIPTKDELKTDSNKTINGLASNLLITSIIASSDFNDLFPQKVIYFKTNVDYYYQLRHNEVYSKLLSQWSALSDKKTRFRWAWNDLMKPTDTILKILQRYVGPSLLIDRGLTQTFVTNDKRFMPEKEVGSSPLFCGHARIGQNSTNPKDLQVDQSRIDDVPALYEFMREKCSEDDCRFFVATDYSFVRRMTRSFFGDKVIHYSGLIMDIDRQRNNEKACSAFKTVIAEQILLSLCDHLIISDSGFSVHAAFLSNSSFGQVYKIEGGKAKVIM